MPFSTSAVEKRAGERGEIRKFHLFKPSLLLNPAGHRQKQRQDKNRRQKSNKEERSQDFPLSDDMIRAAPTEVGGPRRGRLIHWLNLPGYVPDRLFCFLCGLKKAQICLLCLFVMQISLFRFFRDCFENVNL